MRPQRGQDALVAAGLVGQGHRRGLRGHLKLVQYPGDLGAHRGKRGRPPMGDVRRGQARGQFGEDGRLAIGQPPEPLRLDPSLVQSSAQAVAVIRLRGPGPEDGIDAPDDFGKGKVGVDRRAGPEQQPVGKLAQAGQAAD